MKLLTLELLKFGPFTQCVLDFSAPKDAVHLVYGANEAGKSTTLRAVTGLFYGIDVQTRDAHLHDMKNLRLAARIEDARGALLSFERRKGSKDTLRDRADHPVREDVLQAMLGGASKEAFCRMFALDDKTLGEGAKDLLSGKGHLGESLFGAGLGGGIHKVLDRLRKEAEALYSPAAQTKNKALNKEIIAFQEAQKQAQQFAHASEDWLKQRRDWDEVMAEQKRNEEELRTEQARLNKLSRAKRMLPMFAARRHLLEMQAKLRDAPHIGEQAVRERESLSAAGRDALDRIDEISVKINSIQVELGGLVISTELLGECEALERIRPYLPMYSKNKDALSELQRETDALHRKVLDALGRLAPGISIGEIDTSLPEPAAISRMKKAAQQQATSEAALEATARTIAEREIELEQAEEQLSALPPERDTVSLHAIVKQIQRSGDLDRQRKGLGTELEKLGAEARVQLSALPLWRGSLEALAQLPVPSPDSLDRASAEFLELEHQDKQARATLEEKRLQLLSLQRDLEELLRAGDVPSEEELAAARKKRDGVWDELKLRGIGKSKSKDGSDHLIGLTNEFEHQMRWADVLSDRLRREAERVGRRASMLATQHALELEINKFEKEYDEIKQRTLRQREAWTRLWSPCGIEPLSPSEMKDFLHRHAELCRKAERLRQLEQDRGALERDIDSFCEDIRRALSELGEGSLPASLRKGELAPWLTHAGRIAEKIGQIETKRVQLQQKVSELSQQKRKLLAQEAAQREKRAASVAGFIGGLGAFGLDERANAVDVMDRLEALDMLHRDRTAFRARKTLAEEKGREIQAFEDEARRLCAALARELLSMPADKAVAELLLRLKQTLENAAQQKVLKKNLVELGLELEQQRHRGERARLRLLELIQAAGARDLDELAAMEQRAREAAETERKLEENTQKLCDEGEGADLVTLEQELKGLDPDRAEADINVCRAKLSELEQRRKELDTRIGGIENEMKRLGGESKAAAAAAEAQEHLALARAHLDSFVRAKLSVMVLEREMKRFREAQQGPVLQCAGEYFSRMTLGRFSKLRAAYADDDPDRAILQCVRKDGREVLIDELSAGTRDQLFLSLRLASLLQYSKANEPMPLIVDDILVQFDDERAGAALSVLGEVCQYTQVLFFTHHARLLEIAKAAIPAERLREHRLTYG